MHILLGMFQKGTGNLCSVLAEVDGDKKGQTTQQPVFTTSSPKKECPPPLSPEKTKVVVEAFEIYDRETELVLPCYLMMLDLCIKQVIKLN